MTENEGTQDGSTEPGFSFTDKRRVNPEAGEAKPAASEQPAQPEAGPGAEADARPAAEGEAPAAPEAAQPEAAQAEAAPAEDAAEPAAASADASDLGVDIPDDVSGLDRGAVDESVALSPDAQRAAEALNDLQRLNAEYAAYRMRAVREQERAKEAGVVSVAEALIPLLDEVRLATENGDVSGPFEVHVNKLFESLEKVGLTQFGEPGEEFDPAFHEALMQQPSEEVEGPTVFMVMQPGYRLGERVIRAARVGVQQPAD